MRGYSSDAGVDGHGAEAEVVTDEGRSHALADINPGDIVTLEHKDGHASEIRVVRRVFDEYSSPEW